MSVPGSHRRPSRPTGRGKWAWPGFLLGGGAVAAVAMTAGPAGREIGYGLLSLAVIGAVVAGLRMHRPARTLGWWLLAAGTGCGALAHGRWAAELGQGTAAPSLSWADGLSFAMYGLIAAAVAVLASSGRRGAALAGMTEAGIVTCTTVVLAWAFLLDPLLHDRDDWSGGLAVLAYPFLDLVILTMAVRLCVTARPLSRAQQFLVLAVAVIMAADVAHFVSAMTGGPWAGPTAGAAGRLVFLMLLGAAALHPAMATEPGHDQRRRLAGNSSWTSAGLLTVVLIGPAATGYLLISDISEGELDILDVIVPLAATATTAVLLVARLIRAGRLAGQRADDLQAAVDHQAALQREMSHLARHDALTGLPNRLHLDRELAGFRHDGSAGCLLLLDVDGFKHVNESLGHPVGDALLVELAQRLRDTVGPDAVPCRLGGDEFAVLLPYADTAALCEDILAAVRRPADVKGHRLHVTVSIGIRLLSPAAAGAAALSDADLALYEAKAAGRDRAVTYDPGLRVRQAERTDLIERLRAAITAEQFLVHYQPIVTLDTGGFDAVEALVRWSPADGDFVGPDRFVPAAEDSGLIVALGEWVLRQACRDAALWHRRHGTAVTVNVSPRQLMEPDYAATVTRALRYSGLPPSALILEITEGMLADRDDRTLTHLMALRRLGVRVAVDDFGTGYSSLAYLRDLPIDILKIDRSFLPAGASGPGDRQVSFVRTIVDLAHNLELTAVAEGVETPAQVALLRALGCDKAQGFHFGRPRDAAETTEVLAAARLTPAVIGA